MKKQILRKAFKNEANVDNGHTDDQTPPTVEVVTGGKRFIKVDGDVTATQAWRELPLSSVIKTATQQII